MATLSKTTSGRFVVQFRAVTGKGRKAIGLGQVDRQTAESIRGHVTALVLHATTTQPVPEKTRQWLDEIPEVLHAKAQGKGGARYGAPQLDAQKKCPQIKAFDGPEYELLLEKYPQGEHAKQLRRLFKELQHSKRTVRDVVRRVREAMPHIMAADLARLEREVAAAKGENPC